MDILRPQHGAPAPILTVDGGALVATLGDTVRRWPLAGLQLAHYTTSRGVGTRLYRSGWRLLDSSGAVLAWLANWDVPCYDPDEVAAFARRHGLALVDEGALPAGALRRAAPQGSRIGPGTSPAAQVVAPARQWALALGVVGNLMLWWPWGLALLESGSQVLGALSAVVLIGALILSVVPMLIVASLPAGAFRALGVVAVAASLVAGVLLVSRWGSSEPVDYVVPVSLLGVPVTTLAGFLLRRMPRSRAAAARRRVTRP